MYKIYVYIYLLFIYMYKIYVYMLSRIVLQERTSYVSTNTLPAMIMKIRTFLLYNYYNLRIIDTPGYGELYYNYYKSFIRKLYQTFHCLGPNSNPTG